MNINRYITPLLITTASLSNIVKAQNQKPNVIFILADDLGYGDIGCYGQKISQTPYLDQMANDGMRFTDFYAGCTVSAPSRASLMTGLNTGHTKIRGNMEVKPEGQAPMANVETLADVFKRAGYTTGMFGKWGLGYPGSGAEPLDRGFDHFFGYNCQREAHYYFPQHLWNDRQKYIIKANANNKRQVYAPDVIQEHAVNFITNAVKEKKPFFAMLTYTLPHAELNLPHDAIYVLYKGKVIPKPWNKGGYPPTPDAHRSFAAMVSKLDTYVGQIIELTKQLGVSDNTLIIFTSDNGPHLEGGGDPDYFDSNGPLRGYKRDLYEGGVREPMIALWPGKIKPGTINHTPGAFWDFIPTFQTILGEKITQKTDGISLLSNWLGTPASKEMLNRPFYWEFHAYGGKQAIRQGKWKLVITNVDTKQPKIELFNLNKDLGEKDNIASKYPEIVKQLLNEIQQMRTPSKLFPFKNEIANKIKNKIK